MSTRSLKSSYVCNTAIIIVMILIDLIINGTIDLIDQLTDSTIVYVFFAIQLVLRLAMIFMIIVFLWNTFYFKYGLMSILCSRFKILSVTVPLSFIFMIALRALKISATVSKDTMLSLWDSKTYHALYVINGILSAALYVGYFHMISVLSKPGMYLPGEWNK